MNVLELVRQIRQLVDENNPYTDEELIDQYDVTQEQIDKAYRILGSIEDEMNTIFEEKLDQYDENGEKKVK